ncbi:MAG: RHS repeat domain-containing protein, partial [Terriglobia bacterium]
MLNRYSFFRRAAFALLSMPLLASLAFAQITNVTNDTSTPIPGAGHDYVKLLSETVNPANGSVSIRIQVPVPEGRGITIPFSFAYDSNGVQHLAMTSNALWWETNGSFMSNGGWSYAVPMLTFSPGSTTYTVPGPPPQSQIVCGYTSDFVFQNPSGERHGLYIATVNGADHPKCDSSPYVPQAVPSAGDDVYRASFTPACGDSCGAVNPVTVTDADGTNFYFSNSTPDFLHASVGDFPGHSSLPDYVQDRNGNKVIFTDLNLTQGQPLGAFNATDLDNTRTVVSATGFGNNGDTVTVSGLSNSYKLTWTSTTFQFDPPGGVATGGSYCGGYAPAQGSIPVIESITLPESSLSYQFQYDTINGGQTTFGLLQRVTYPDGGYVRYVWGYPQQGYSMEAEGPDSLGHPAACGIQYSMPVVLHRYVSDGTREVLQQDFSYTTDWNSPGDGKPWKTTTVVTTDLQRPGSPAPNFTTVYTYSPYPIPDQPNDLQASGSVNTNVPLEQEIDYSDWTSGGGGLLSKVKKSWQDQFLMTCQSTTQGGTTSRIDYTYTPYGGQITDKKEWDWGASDCSTTASGNLLRETQIVYHTFSGAPLIFDRPDSVTIYGTIDPSTSGEASQTQYTDYDGVGNAGDKIQICLYRCSETGNLTTQYHYYGDGQVQYIIDPNLNRTQYSYACNDAYVTQVIYPSTNGVAHVANFQYGNCASGSLTQSSDENSPPNNTLYDYTDPLGRLKQVTYPDGGQSTYTYNDTPPTPSVEIDRKMDNSGNIFRTVQVMDGLGRVTQTQTGPSTNPVLVDTKYDGSGLAWQVSNPHYNSGSPSDGTTTYAYDALGRPANEGPSNYAVQYPDGSYASTTYSANCSTVADASLRTRILCSDGAGRLTAVTEDPGGLGYATGYTYDALDDLLTVSQSGQGRSFLYDSFSRLTNATNPESGAVSYLYDSNSNVLSKADARGTTRYGYDELNRLLYKNYDPPDTSTVRACYAYDGVSAPPWGGTMNNPVGHLTSSWSVQHDGTVVAANESYQFDPMGRMTAGAQCTPGTCGQTFYSLGAGYNLLGNETGFSDSSSARSTTYDTTDRLLNFSATLPGMQNQNLLTSPQYGPVGMIQASLGNGLTETRGYNNRTWLQSLTVGSVYSLGLAYEGNGNVHSANDSVNGNWSYGYDGVNRLQTASGNGQSFA